MSTKSKIPVADEEKDLGTKVAFGPYELHLATNGQISYYKNKQLSKVRDKAIDFNSKDLYQHALGIAKSLGYRESDLKKA